MTTLERPDLSPTVTTEAVLQSRYRGCLLGGAVGDALGAPVEFMDDAQILRSFGPGGIRDYAHVYGGLGRITDDTQMTLFTAEGMMRAHVRARLRGTAPAYASVTALAYQRWLLTQERSPPARGAGDEDSGWLMSHRELFSDRAAGLTCRSALQVRKPAGKLADNDSKGCGGVMRVAPVGMYFAGVLAHADGRSAHDDGRSAHPAGCSAHDDIRQPFEVAATLAGLTHGHPTGQLTAGVFAAVIALLLGGTVLTRAVQVAIRELCTHANHEETWHALETALALAVSNPADPHALRSLGEGWIAEEALAMSVYCALSARDFESAIVLAVNHAGDSDSTGAITGSILGATMGVEAIPERWLQPLELREAIQAMADDLRTVHGWKLDDGGFDAEEAYWRTRYPGH